MDHLLLGLEESHVDAVEQLREQLASAAGVVELTDRSPPHITLLAFDGGPDPTDRASVLGAVAPVAASVPPFTVRAHGIGLYTGTAATDLNIHVPVVRTDALDALHRRTCEAVRLTGATIAPWTDRELWTPHITILDRVLDPGALARATAWLAERAHPSWQVAVARITLTRGWAQRHLPDATLPLEGATPAG